MSIYLECKSTIDKIQFYTFVNLLLMKSNLNLYYFDLISFQLFVKFIVILIRKYCVICTGLNTINDE